LRNQAELVPMIPAPSTITFITISVSKQYTL
jgi:hypothetical protein